MKKVLFVTHNGRFLVQFELNDIQILQKLGYEVHCATNFDGETMRADAENTLKEHGVICHSIPIERSPLRLRENLNAYRALKSLLKKSILRVCIVIPLWVALLAVWLPMPHTRHRYSIQPMVSTSTKAVH